MKKTLLFFCLFGFSGILNAQNTFPTPSGNVGIGTTTPQAKLDINTFSSSLLNIKSFSGNNGINLTSAYGVGGDYAPGIVWSSSDNTGPGIPKSGIWSYFTPSGSYLQFGTSNSYVTGITNSAVTIDYLGNVGIGTSTPGSRLQVDAGFSPDIAKFVSKPTATLRGGGFYADESNNGRAILWLDANGGDFINADYFYISHKTSTGGTDFIVQNAAPVTFHTNATERLRVDASGNVGIGTTAPDSKLTVAGKIHSQEVKVSIDAGADFVFEKGYNLPSLSETEQYIAANKHLPEIASAEEMKKDGIELGQMNIKLLQKIEELTLHLINQNKLIEQQKLQLEQQDKRLEKLEK